MHRGHGLSRDAKAESTNRQIRYGSWGTSLEHDVLRDILGRTSLIEHGPRGRSLRHAYDRVRAQLSQSDSGSVGQRMAEGHGNNKSLAGNRESFETRRDLSNRPDHRCIRLAAAHPFGKTFSVAALGTLSSAATPASNGTTETPPESFSVEYSGTLEDPWPRVNVRPTSKWCQHDRVLGS
jgi:hypothetical protein